MVSWCDKFRRSKMNVEKPTLIILWVKLQLRKTIMSIVT